MHLLVDFRTEDQELMCKELRVRWTITPLKAPQPWITCSGCRDVKPFQPSGKIRLNANGRKLDAWLIYKCLTCDRTWNRPIFERQSVRDINAAILEALKSNDPDWVRSEAFNISALGRKAQRIDEFPEVHVEKAVIINAGDFSTVAIEMVASLPASLRLDRLLANELGLSRTRVKALADRGLLKTSAQRDDILRHRVRSGTVVTLSLAGAERDPRYWSAMVTGTAM
ncbi:DUF1062 domain-containing protein [Martelella mediterranea]|uniref:DUF1062 domain-containing protein n=1 Tax=Martelella mediterranea DSM 17316 TaxID=1122214 RepID=A0A1U9YY86_9HYPH|nr:DUF1062 domain-containing protein [Martelella mediterranea]AQZ50396.1 hypothetical protein Mame_01025 [Martelella mediterranea DSM 17316]